MTHPRLAAGSQSKWRWILIAAALLSALEIPSAIAQSGTVKAAVSDPLSQAPGYWISEAAANELIALHHENSYLRYHMHVIDEKGNQVRDVVESKEGTVARLILRDDKPLTKDQDDAERQRLDGMLASPAAFAKHIKNTESDRKVADRLVPLMTTAMLFQYVPGQPQTTADRASAEVVIDYKPNPNWNPPTTEAQALSGLEGRVWIDSRSHQLIRMEGHISHAVNFGWGVLAHIYPGGRLALNQTNAGGSRWIFTDFSMQTQVRALMVKTINVNTHVQASKFQTLAPMSYQDAIHLLLNTPLP
ncbi:MAG: hypothetical protein M3Y50_08025 [Acidobacteriota bacterium]|nr:hypothetical protein [Acidobacteriota bacterium]